MNAPPLGAIPGRNALAGISLRQLRAFICVAAEGSLARAARQLHLTPSALSMLIRGLESELGTRLFERTTRKMQLTPAAEALLPTVSRVFAELEAAFERIRQQEAARQGLLTIATSPMLAATWLPERIAAFAQRFPQFQLRLMDLPVNEVADAVRDGRADCGLCTLDAATSLVGLASRVVYQDRLMLCCLPGHPFAKRREVQWRELSGIPLIVLRHGSGLRTLVDRVFETLSEPLVTQAEVSQVTTVIGMVQAGLGLGLLPHLALLHGWSKDISGVQLVDPLVTRDIVLLTATARPPPAIIDVFLADFLAGLS